MDEQSQNSQAPKPKGFLKVLPIIAGVSSCMIIGLIGVLVTLSSADADTSSSQVIGLVALVVSGVVFYFTKKWVDNRKK